jgi:hypothetical protein
MKKKSTLPKDLQKALDLFPKIVAKKRKDGIRKQRFIEKTFGELARKVDKQVRGKQSKRRMSGS